VFFRVLLTIPALRHYFPRLSCPAARCAAEGLFVIDGRESFAEIVQEGTRRVPVDLDGDSD
jgi:hypothetical protein